MLFHSEPRGTLGFMPSAGLFAYRYELVERLGRGGAARTYVVRDLIEGGEVALKLLDPALPHALLRREFERLRGLAHPHLSAVHDFAITRVDGKPRALYTATLVRGGELGAFVREAGIAAAHRVLADVLDGLSFLHAAGLRHGDVKPENVLIDAAGRAVLIDLGCAAPLGQPSATLSGTRGYLAPELLAGQPADERADLFAFGVMLRELGVPDGPLGALAARLVAPDPAARPSSAREVLGMLGDARELDGPRGRAAGLCGREPELEAALAGLASVRRGERHPRGIWIEGPHGIGRSRLLRELGVQLADSGVDVLVLNPRVDAPIRDGLTRRAGSFEPGVEALLEQLDDLGQGPCVLLLDDAQELSQAAEAELALALRGLSTRGRAALVVASTAPPPVPLAPHLARIALAPLAAPALAAWAGPALTAAQLADFVRFTGGYPRYIERALSAIAAGRLSEAGLAALDDGALTDDSRRSLMLALHGLDAAEKTLLAEVALAGSSARPVTRRLLERDLVAHAGERVQLVRTADAAALLDLLPARVVRPVRLHTARTLATRDDVASLATAAVYFAREGKTRATRTLLERALAAAEVAPRQLADRLAELSIAQLSLSLAQQVALARVCRMAGASPRALTLLAGARRQGCSPALLQEAAEVYLALGRLPRAERMIARCSEDGDPARAELRARVLVRRGDYAGARAVAERALPGAADDAARARLLEALALSSAYLGDHASALAHIEAAHTLHPDTDARARARSASLRGFVLLHAGEAQRAVAAYDEAHALAEAAGLSDLVLNALANGASARQSLGLWGTALATYERALRLARALGRRGSVRSLRANMANLALELGAFERAARLLDQLARDADAVALARSLALYRAELALLSGDASAALATLATLDPRADLPPRERGECAALEALAQLALGAPEAAERALMVSVDATLPADVQARRAEAEARVQAALGRARPAITALEASLRTLRTSADQALLARLEGVLSELYAGLSADALAREQRTRARARWERIALDLPPTLRDAFWAHPHRRALARPPTSERTGARTTLSLSRVRELNRRIGALRTRDEILTFALAAAIELTCAERGFVLLRKGDGFEVAAAEQMDRARTPKRAWKWSRSIAERVIEDGEPVLTVDAAHDPRFARNASVHAMHLKSVLCAPIRGAHEILGALYLDNRVARARFAEEDAELLLTFADQVAIALNHAALIRALDDKARELAREKRKVEALADGRAREIERLEDELTAQRAASGMRYDYAEIVGRSEPMRAVLSVLDRVVDTDLTVLVTGESGTGKELVARALHRLGSRSDKPFVSINCAALPEQLLESELFGHVKGAFTGALSAREGLFATARGGTLLLDELGELPLSMQAKLLRVLSDGEVRPVGATKSFAVDVRIVCATNRNLKQCVADGSFREDLYYRVSVVELSLPPLRERHDDIVPIAEALLARRAEETGTPAPRLAPETIRTLLAYPFPGNVRELSNLLLRASVMAVNGVIRPEDLDLSESGRRAVRGAAKSREEFAAREAERLLSALTRERWNVSKVAKDLGIPRNTLYRKLARYGIQRG